MIIYVHSSSKTSGQLLAYPALRIRCFCLRLKPETPAIFMVIFYGVVIPYNGVIIDLQLVFRAITVHIHVNPITSIQLRPKLYQL